MQVVPYQDPHLAVGAPYAGGTVRHVEYHVVDHSYGPPPPHVAYGPTVHQYGPVPPPPAPSASRGNPYGPSSALMSMPNRPPALSPYASITGSANPYGRDPNYPVDASFPGFNHVPMGDGFTSPYEALPQNLNRNPYYKSWYDVPNELREAPRPPPDFVISQHDPEHQYLQTLSPEEEEVMSRPAGISRFRFRIFGQREEELKDAAPVVQMADFQVFDLENNPYPMQQFGIACTSPGFSDEGCGAEKLLDGEPNTKFLRRDFGEFPVDLELDFGQPIPIGSYSWRTANENSGRDPVSWQLQALIKGKWIVVDEVQNCTVPKARYTQVGPFGLANVPQELVYASEQYLMQPPMHAPLYELEEASAPPTDHYPAPSATRSIPYDQIPKTRPAPKAPPQPVQPVQPSALPIPRGINAQATVILHDILVQPGVDRLAARVQELLRKGADAVSPDTKGRTPLIKACRKGDPAVLTMLLDYGADVNARTHAGESPLHRVALNGDVQSLETLLRAGADPNLQDGQGDTPLALATARADPGCVSLLLRAGGRADIRNFKQLTGLDMLHEDIRRQGFETAAAREVRRLITQGVGPYTKPAVPSPY